MQQSVFQVWCVRAVVMALVACAGSAHAAHPLVSDDTGTQGSGHWQWELNTDHSRTREDGASTWERELNTALTYGLTDTLDLALNLPWLHHHTTGGSRENGVGDVTLLAKWRFIGADEGWSLALRPELTLPIGSENKGLGNGRATGALTLLSAYASGPWTWLTNAGYTYNDNKAGDRKHLWAVSTAALYAINDQWTVAGDIGISRAADKSTSTERYGLLGLMYSWREGATVDVGWRRSLGGGPTTHTLGVGLTLAW